MKCKGVFVSFPRSGSQLLISLLRSTRHLRVVKKAGIVPREGGWIDPIMQYDMEYDEENNMPYALHFYRIEHKAEPVINHICKLTENRMKFIHLIRKNKIAQALSNHKSSQTKVAYLHKNSPQEMIDRYNEAPEITEAELMDRTIRLFFVDQAWQTFFETHGIEPLRVYYEDISDESKWQDEISKILDFLEILYKRPLSISTNYVKQSDYSDESFIYSKLVKHCNNLMSRIVPEYLPFGGER